MDTPTPSRPIVVGTDDSPSAARALTWAAADAERLRRPLHLVHAYGVPLASVDADPGGREAGAESRAEQTLRTALAAAGALTRQPVTGVVVKGSAAGALVAASTGADVVVGSRGRGELGGVVLGSVSLQVATHAAGPVVVVRELPGADAEPPRVVVGIDGSAASQDCLAFGFEQAASLGAVLDVVHAWPYGDGAPGPAYADGTARTHGLVARHEQVVDEALDGWSDKHPDVEVRRFVVHGTAVEALVEQARGAVLLVVSSRGLGGFSSLLLGSVSHGVLHLATCPVAVVRPAG